MELSTETVSENKEPPRTVTEKQYTGIGGWYYSLKNLKKDVDCAFNRFDGVDFSRGLLIEYAYVETSRLETPEEVDARITEEQLAHEHDRQQAVETIENIARKHGLAIRWE